MNELIKVTVVMPTYNGSKFINRAIESILSQTHKNFEFIIVDDGSTDDTAEIIKSYKDDRIKYLYQENKGPASAYNTGFKNASTDFIFIMDHDDYSYPPRIDKQLEFLVTNKLDVCGTYFIISTEENVYSEKKRQPINDKDIKRELLYKPSALFNPTLCIRKSIFSKYGYYSTNFPIGYDFEFLLRISDRIKCGNLNDFLYCWTKRKTSFGHTNQKEGRKTYMELALRRIDLNLDHLNCKEKYFIRGMVFYHANQFAKASQQMINSLLKGNLNYKIFLYLNLVTIFSPLVTYMRKQDLFSHPIIVRLKNILLGKAG